MSRVPFAVRDIVLFVYLGILYSERNVLTFFYDEVRNGTKEALICFQIYEKY